MLGVKLWIIILVIIIVVMSVSHSRVCPPQILSLPRASQISPLPFCLRCVYLITIDSILSNSYLPHSLYLHSGRLLFTARLDSPPHSSKLSHFQVIICTIKDGSNSRIKPLSYGLDSYSGNSWG